MCGYCTSTLVRAEAGRYECPSCAPMLRAMGAKVSDVAPLGMEWIMDEFRMRT